MIRTNRAFSITPFTFALFFACTTTMIHAASVDPAHTEIETSGGGKSSSTWDAAGESSAEAWSKTKEASSDIWEATKETGADAWDATKEFSDDAWDATREGSSKAWDKTKEFSGDAWEATKEGSVDAWESTKEWVGGSESEAPVMEPPAETSPGEATTSESHTEI